MESQLAYPASLQALHSNTWKQIIQIEHNRIKNPNWQEVTSCLFTSVAEDFNSYYNREQIQQVARAGLETRPPDWESDAPTTQPRCLIWVWLMSVYINKIKTKGNKIIYNQGSNYGSNKIQL